MCPRLCLRSSNVEQTALNRTCAGSSPAGGTTFILLLEVWPNGRVRRLGRWDWRFDSSHLDDNYGHPRARPAIALDRRGNDETQRCFPARRLKGDSGFLFADEAAWCGTSLPRKTRLGSNPVVRSTAVVAQGLCSSFVKSRLPVQVRPTARRVATVAQPAERLICNQEVPSSILGGSSITIPRQLDRSSSWLLTRRLSVRSGPGELTRTWCIGRMQVFQTLR